MELLTLFNIQELAGKLSDPYEKIALTISSDAYFILNRVLKSSPRVVNIDSLLAMKGIGTHQYNFIFWFVEDMMRLLIPAGIPQYCKKTIYSALENKKFGDSSEPKVFSVDDLAFGFIVWAVACLLATAVFLIEIAWFYSIKLLRAERRKRQIILNRTRDTRRVAQRTKMEV